MRSARVEPNKYDSRGRLVREETELESITSEEARQAKERPNELSEDGPNVSNVEYETV